MKAQALIFCLLLTVIKLSAQDPSRLSPDVFEFNLTMKYFYEEGHPEKTYSYNGQTLIKESRSWNTKSGQYEEVLSQDTVVIDKEKQLAIEKFCNTHFSEKKDKWVLCRALSPAAVDFLLFNRGKFSQITHHPCKKDAGSKTFESLQQLLESYF